MDISTPDCVKYAWGVETHGSKCKDSLKVHFAAQTVTDVVLRTLLTEAE